MSETISISLKYTPEEFRSVAYFYFRKALFLNHLWWIVSILLGTTIYGYSSGLKILIVIGIFSIILLLLFAIGLPSRRFYRLGLDGKEYLYTFSENEITVKTRYSYLTLAWLAIDQCWKNKNSYLLLFNYGQQVIHIPKRVFTSREEEEKFKSLLKQKLGNKFQ